MSRLPQRRQKMGANLTTLKLLTTDESRCHMESRLIATKTISSRIWIKPVKTLVTLETRNLNWLPSTVVLIPSSSQRSRARNLTCLDRPSRTPVIQSPGNNIQQTASGMMAKLLHAT